MTHGSTQWWQVPDDSRDRDILAHGRPPGNTLRGWSTALGNSVVRGGGGSTRIFADHSSSCTAPVVGLLSEKPERRWGRSFRYPPTASASGVVSCVVSATVRISETTQLTIIRDRRGVQ